MKEDAINGDEMCSRCEKNHANDEHSCPFLEEINGDYETLCNCCDDCESECCDER